LSRGGDKCRLHGILTTAKVGGHTVLGEPYLTGIRWVKFPLYTFGGDLSANRTNCAENAAAPRRWATATASRPSAARSAWSSTRNRDESRMGSPRG
jgi:hypothetical protein